MSYSLSPLTPDNAQYMISWRYDSPYDRYDLSPDHISGLLNPGYRYHQVQDQSGELIGFCCFGEDARVPGGEYDEGEPAVLDIGAGMRPDLTGQGLGKRFIEAVLNFAKDTYHPEVYRVTIADFNQRSLKTFQNLGFIIRGQFSRSLSDVQFTQLERHVDEDSK